MSTETIMEALLQKGGAIDVLTNFIVAVYGVIAAYYIFTSAANAKALRLLGYQRAWLAWIPYLRYYALAAATKEDGQKTRIFDRWDLPTVLYELWFPLLFLVQIMDHSTGDIFMVYMSVPGMLLYFIVMAIFLGATYTKVYAKLQNKTEKECITLGLWSGVLPILAAIEFCAVRKNKVPQNTKETAEETV